jgi:plasmid stability protein
MKNVTIMLDEEVAQWARIWAAKHHTSVSCLVGEMLRERMLEEEGYEAAMKQYLIAKPVVPKRQGKCSSRDKLHERR